MTSLKGTCHPRPSKGGIEGAMSDGKIDDSKLLVDGLLEGLVGGFWWMGWLV